MVNDFLFHFMEQNKVIFFISMVAGCIIFLGYSKRGYEKGGCTFLYMLPPMLWMCFENVVSSLSKRLPDFTGIIGFGVLVLFTIIMIVKSLKRDPSIFGILNIFANICMMYVVSGIISYMAAVAVVIGMGILIVIGIVIFIIFMSIMYMAEEEEKRWRWRHGL